jgi:hypothetical protein
MASMLAEGLLEKRSFATSRLDERQWMNPMEKND